MDAIFSPSRGRRMVDQLTGSPRAASVQENKTENHSKGATSENYGKGVASAPRSRSGPGSVGGTTRGATSSSKAPTRGENYVKEEKGKAGQEKVPGKTTFPGPKSENNRLPKFAAQELAEVSFLRAELRRANELRNQQDLVIQELRRESAEKNRLYFEGVLQCTAALKAIILINFQSVCVKQTLPSLFRPKLI